MNLKPSLQIIPLNKTFLQRERWLDSSHRVTISRYGKMHPYISDPQLIPRIQEYIYGNGRTRLVDVNTLADALQEKYKEYLKRKKTAFRASVKKAYSIVLKKYGLDAGESSSEEEITNFVRSTQPNQSDSLNNQLVNLYARHSAPKPMEDNELIDISSDDSEDDKSKDKNGPSTSNQENDVRVCLLYRDRENDDSQSLPGNDIGKKRKLEALETTSGTSAKKRKSLAVLQEPSVTFKDIAGINSTLIEICKLLVHIQHPEVYRQIGISPPRGFLLHGPPGCGKTLLANAIAGELGIPLLKVAAPELVAGVSGESEERIRELFERAICSTPCVLFIDEIDAITPNRQNAQREMERRIVAQLISCLDDINQNRNADKVLLIGATNRPDSMDPSLRRAGRFDREIKLGIPDTEARKEILQTMTKKLQLEGNFDFLSIAKLTPGYVGADLLSLTREAAMIAINRVLKDIHEEDLKNQKSKSRKESTDAQPTKNDQEKTSEKDDPEIIVDDDENQSKDSENLAEVNSTNNDETILVDEDETQGPKEKKTDKSTNTEQQSNGEILDQSKDSTSETVEDIPGELFQKDSTQLKDLLSLLHYFKPVSDKRLTHLSITTDDFLTASKHVQPSAKREGFATVPDVTWEDIGSLKDIREELQMTILAPVKHEEQFKALGLSIPAGILLCGPPGCGKTLLAKAIANEAGINFISVKGPELLNMYVGESERAVRICFERARNSAPCVIFFDELDALCPKRSNSREGGATMRVVNQMLTEMDGIESRSGVFLLAATNRPDIVDSAILRPGRLDKILYVGLPTASDRIDILKTITKNGTKPLLATDVNLERIGQSDELDGYTGADLAALVREAATIALKEIMILGNSMSNVVVTMDHFIKAIGKICPSVSEKDRKHYEELRKLYTPSSVDSKDERMELS